MFQASAAFPPLSFVPYEKSLVLLTEEALLLLLPEELGLLPPLLAADEVAFVYCGIATTTAGAMISQLSISTLLSVPSLQ